MPDVEFFWDPACPWAWITSRWVVNVLDQRPMEVDWRFISLRLINEHRDYGRDLPPGYERRHTRGLELLRVAAALREELGRDAVLPFYTAVGGTIHEQGDEEVFDDRRGVERVLDDLGYPVRLAEAAASSERDDSLRSEGREALDRCGGDVGTPVMSFRPPEGPSFFGPVINRAPAGRDALDMWDAVVELGCNPHFSELKRSLRSEPQFDR